MKSFLEISVILITSLHTKVCTCIYSVYAELSKKFPHYKDLYVTQTQSEEKSWEYEEKKCNDSVFIFFGGGEVEFSKY